MAESPKKKSPKQELPISERLLVDGKKASQMLGISEKTLSRMRKNKEISYLKIGKRNLFSVQDLKEFVESRKEESTVDLMKHIYQEEHVAQMKLIYVRGFDKYLEHLENLKKNLKNGGNKSMIKGSACYENLPNSETLNLGFGGYELDKRNKKKTYRIFWYDDCPETGKRKAYYKVVPHATCPEEAYIALEVKRIELFKKWLFKGEISQPQTVMDSGTVKPNTNGNCPKFRDFVEQWMKNNPQRKSQKTLASQKSTIEKHFIPYFGEYRMNEITRDHVDDFFTKQNNETDKWQTLKNRYSILHALFEEALERELIDKNPVSRRKGKKPFKPEKEKVEILTDNEFKAIYDNAEEHLKSQLVCYWNTGMRKMEVLTLQVRDIDLKEKEISIRAENAKSSKHRIIPINGELISVLEKQIKGKDQNDYVFTYCGKRMKNNHGAFQSAIEKAGIGRKVKLHHLRHRFGTWLMQNKTPDKIAMEILGHSDPKVLHIYQHPNKEDKHKAVNGNG